MAAFAAIWLALPGFANRKSDTRMRLVAAMIELAARRGCAEASVERVIDGAGVARATFYEHFSDRDECFLVALKYVGARLVGAIETACQEGEGNETAQAAVAAIVDFAAAESAAARFLFVESLAAGPKSLRLREEILDRVTALIEAGWAKESETEIVLNLPAKLAVGGAFRLLAMRLRRKEPEFEDLRSGIVGWLGSYAVQSGQPMWRHRRELGAIEPLSPELLPSLEMDPPLRSDGSRRSSAAVRRNQRRRILRATATCSYEKGYAEVSVTDIVDAARVSRKTFYAHFQKKADAGTEANEETFQVAMSATAAAFFAAHDWPERIWEAGRVLLSFIAIYPAVSHLAFVEAHAIGEATVKHIYDRLQAFTLFLEEGYNFRPQIQAPPRLSSEAIAATMFELASDELRRGQGADALLQLLPQLAYMILAPFMGSQEATEFVRSRLDGRP